MSTTTDPAGLRLAPCAAALAAWFVLVVAITAIAEPSSDVVVFGPPERTLALLEGGDSRIVEVGERTLKIRGMSPGFVMDLYANGAWLVLPARAGSCRTPARPIS
jgi:hypothetical protein